MSDKLILSSYLQSFYHIWPIASLKFLLKLFILRKITKTIF